MNVKSAISLSACLLAGAVVRAQSGPATAPARSEGKIQSIGVLPPTVRNTQTPQNVYWETLQPYTVSGQVNGQQPFTSWTIFGANQPDEGVGAQLLQADHSLRAALNLPTDRGLVVNNLIPNGPAAQVGLQPNDILLTLFEKPLDKPEDVVTALTAAQAGTPAPHSATLTLLRAGKPTTISVRAVSKVVLASMPATPTPEYFIGVRTSPVDETLRSHLTIPAGTGVVVLEVIADTPAAKAGMVAGDIILSYEGKPLPASETLHDLIQSEGAKKAILAVIRKGTETKVVITPEVRKTETAVNAHPPVRLWSSANNEKIVLDLQEVVSSMNNATVDLSRNTQTRNLILTDSPQAELSKKIDDLTSQIHALSKAVEELRKEKK